MRFAAFKTWIFRGIYPRLFIPILLMIVAVSLLRYYVLVQSERQESEQRVALSLQNIQHYLLPQLAVAGDFPDQLQPLLDREAAFNPWMKRLQWQTDGFLALVKNPVRATAVPAWFTAWMDLSHPRQALLVPLSDGRQGELVLDFDATSEVAKIWATVGKQLLITALSTVLILGLVTLLLRANARLLGRLVDRHAALGRAGARHRYG